MGSMTRSVVAAVLGLSLGLGLLAGAALAAGGGGDSTPAGKQDAAYAEAKQLVEAGQYQPAIALLRKSLEQNPANADAYNYLGYSLRKSGDRQGALVNYRKALAIEPEHRGANEYLGELYLEMGQLDKAKERLAVLDRACFFGCEEYSELKALIEDFEAKSGG